jgi:hypothetical protein
MLLLPETSLLTRVNDDQDSLPSLVDVSERRVLGVKDISGVVEVVVERFVSLDVDGGSVKLVDLGSEVGHFGWSEKVVLVKTKSEWRVNERIEPV